MAIEVPIEQLRKICDPQLLDCDTSQEVKPLESIIGQKRAVKALKFGLGIKSSGFNTYVAGMPGTGKETAVRRFLEEEAKDKPVPNDWCYVNNFQDSYLPKALNFPPGQAKTFKADMAALISSAKRDIRTVFESDEYIVKREELLKALHLQHDALLAQLNEKVRKEGFLIKSTPLGLLAIALDKEGKPLDDEGFASLNLEEQARIAQRREELKTELKAVLRQGKELQQNTDKKLEKLDQSVAMFALNHLIEDIQEKYRELPDVIAYTVEVKDDILNHLSDFQVEPKSEQTLSLSNTADKDSILKRYEVNVLVENEGLDGVPVITELNPTYNKLFGRIEKEAQFGTLITDFTMIRNGSLHRANGGYLVLPVEEVLTNLFTWDSLKRALINQEIAIEEASERLGFVTSKSLQPEPIPLKVKVILIGRPILYYLLHTYDKDFSELFKVKADFDTRMARTPENIRDYVAFTSTLCNEEKLRHLDRSALVKVIEHSSRLAEDQEKLSTKFGELSDVIREASFYATEEDSPYTTAAHIQKAVREHFYRSNLIQERIQELITRGTLLIDVTDQKVGQINGLSVAKVGDIFFGQPSRITATTSLGKGDLIDIEREAELSGPIHTKGVMILTGYLAETFAQERPLSLSARLVFEQSYSGVEGDSASSAELYALLSSLSGIPIKQGIAVTGSVNQKGEIQAIGGVNEKIEGFFDVCQAKGLTGEQGVLIPESNVKHLMLKEEVVAAVQEGRFHIWSVKTVDEGIDLLTGIKAGERREDGTFEQGTISASIDQRLNELAEAASEFAQENGEEKKRI